MTHGEDRRDIKLPRSFRARREILDAIDKHTALSETSARNTYAHDPESRDYVRRSGGEVARGASIWP